MFRVLLERASNLRLAIPDSDLRYKNAALVHRMDTMPVSFR
ncbi:MAG: hypothetical protein ACPG7F_20065 [Aggregatilineales bacterium]